jgi:hypothetical protein
VILRIGKQVGVLAFNIPCIFIINLGRAAYNLRTHWLRFFLRIWVPLYPIHYEAVI